MNKNEEVEELSEPLLQHTAAAAAASTERISKKQEAEEQKDLKTRVWGESKKLWHIVGPSIVYRVATTSMNLVTQVIVGHLGDLELASISIANTVLLGFNFGLLLGMASALETLCGQAFGAKKYHMLGVYMQRSLVVLNLFSVLLTPIYIFATPILKLLGQADDVAEQSGLVALWLIPMQFSFAFQFPLQRFLQSQLKTGVLIWASLLALLIHVFISWLLVYQLGFGLVGAIVALDISWWSLVVVLLLYSVCGWCPQTWTGLSLQAFSGLWEFVKLSASSGVMLCLENWYYKILLLMTGYFKSDRVAVDAVSICMNINSWEIMFALAFFAGAGVRVANELGAGNGTAAKFATIVSVVQSTAIGAMFFVLTMILGGKLAFIFSASAQVAEAVDKLSFLLASSLLLNSIQPVLSGVAVGSGWQALVAYVNIFCYYIVGLPVGLVLAWVFDIGVKGMWAGMIFGGTATQTVALVIMTMKCNWQQEAEKATLHVQKWSTSTADSQSYPN